MTMGPDPITRIRWMSLRRGMARKIKKKGARKGSLVRRTMNADQTAAAFPRGARLILPAFRQRVQTLIFWIFPSSSMRATWRLGRHVRRVLLFACETLLPKATPFLHT